MTIEEANNNLKVIEQIRQHPDYESAAPESKAKFDAVEAKSRDFVAQYQAGSHDRNLARAGVEDAVGTENYAKADMGEMPPPQSFGAMPPVGSAASPALPQGYGRAVRHQMGATAAAVSELVPGLIPAVEGIGLNLKKRGISSQLPQPGDTAAYINDSPSPLAARGGAMLGTYLAGRGAMGGSAQSATTTAFKPLDAAYQGGKALVRKVLPRSNVAANAVGGAAAGLESGLVNAGVTRAAQALAPGEKVRPLTLGELAIPTLAGGAMGMLPGVAKWVTDPSTAGGRIAQRFANATKSGTRRQVRAEETDVPVAGSEPPNPNERASKEFDNTIEGASVNAEGKFAKAHANAESDWMKKGYGPAYDALLAQNKVTSPQSTISKLDDLIKSKASQSATRDVPAKPTGLLDEYGKPMMGEPSQEDTQALLTLGSNLRSLKKQFESYLGEGATLRDYKNAIDQASSLAQQNRTSKVAERAYGEVEAVLRKDAYNAFPGFRELSEQHKTFQDNHERETDLVYGKKGSHDAEDTSGISSQRRGREFFKKATDEAPGATTDSNELALRSDYGQEGVAGMRAAKESASTKYGEREAIEMSKLTGGRGFVQPAAMAALHPTGYMAAHAAINSGFALPRLVQPIRSRIATMLPDQEAMQLAVPMVAGEAGSQAAEALSHNRFPSVDDMVNQAREHAKKAKRWGATILERQQAKK